MHVICKTIQIISGEQSSYEAAESAVPEPQHAYTPPPDMRTVLYDYNTGVDGDLVATAGERVAVLKYLDADWCMAHSERTGREGMIAINYLDTNKSPRYESDDIRWRHSAWGRESSTSIDVSSYISAQTDTLTPLPSEINNRRFANAFSSTSSTPAPRAYSVDVAPPSGGGDDWFAGFDAAKEVATAQQRRSMPPPRPSAPPSIAPTQKPSKTDIPPPISTNDKSKRANLHRELLESEQKFVEECAAVDECLAAVIHILLHTQKNDFCYFRSALSRVSILQHFARALETLSHYLDCWQMVSDTKLVHFVM